MSRTLGLVLVPALISLAVTFFRLAGELQRWSERWFSTATQGVIPSGVNALVGITWLAAPFGIYFALKLRDEGCGPRGTPRACGHALAGLAVCLCGFFLVPFLPVSFPRILLVIWSLSAVAAGLQWRGWPELASTLLAYGLAARIPVVVIMFFAMSGNWGTHYDYVGMPEPFQMPLWPRFFWLAFFPQLVAWVGFTVLLGSLAGSIALALTGRRHAERVAVRT